MKQNEEIEEKMLNTLSNQEVMNLYGGYAPPTEEELEIHGPMGIFICW